MELFLTPMDHVAREESRHDSQAKPPEGSR
jgi:hypothetical protein